MNAIILWIVIIGILTGLFFLARLYIVKYFESKKGRFDADKSNFITSIGIGAILTAFLVINPSMILQLINVVIEFFNRTLSTRVSPLDYQPGFGDITAFSILCLTIFGLIFVSYRHRKQLHEQHLAEISAQAKEERIIQFPESRYYESPHLYDRILELFELKYKKNGLKMSETKQPGEDKFIYGWYRDDFHTYFEMAYCESSRGNDQIGREDIERIFHYLNQELYPKISEGHKNPIAHFYYISESGVFAPVTDQYPMVCLTEKEFLHTVIHFSPYLKKLVEKFQKEKLFSAIQKEEDKKTLSETFIEPGFKVGEEELVHEGLTGYLRSWLRDGSDSKHQVLLGGYGMGKTSFMKYFAANLAHSILDNKETGRIPVFISLTNCSPTHGGIKKTIQAFVAESLGIEYDLFERLIEKGKFVFLLDAFDEMGFIGTNQQRFKQFNEIWQLAVKNNKIILSGRPSYFPTEFEMHDTLAIPAPGEEVLQTRPYAGKVILSDLDETRISKYIAKYYPAEVETYINWIKKDRSLFELCKRPSMMHIIREMLPTLYEQERDKDITAGKLINQYITHWIGRQQSKNIQSAFEENERRKTEFIFSFFTDLAADIYLTSELKMPGREVLVKLREKMQAFGIQGIEKPEIKEGIEQEMMTGYFIEREMDAFKFVHKSFFEYFVSLRIADLLKRQNTTNRIMGSMWSSEINDFIFDAIPSKFKNNSLYPSLIMFAGKNELIWSIKIFFFSIPFYLNSIFVEKSKLILFWSTILTALFGIIYRYKTEILTFIYSLFIFKNNEITGINIEFIKKFFEYYAQNTQPRGGDLSVLLLPVLLIIVWWIITSNDFVKKAVLLGISKNEKASLRLLNRLFSYQDIAGVFINNIVIEKVNRSFLFEGLTIRNSIFQNVTLRSKIKNIKIVNSTFESVKIEGIFFRDFKFENTILLNVDFKNLKCKIYFSAKALRYIVRFSNQIKRKIFRHDRFSQNPEEELILNEMNFSIINTSPSQIDEYTINSLVQFMLINKLRLGIEVKTDDWLQEVLRQKLEMAASGKNF